MRFTTCLFSLLLLMCMSAETSPTGRHASLHCSPPDETDDYSGPGPMARQKVSYSGDDEIEPTYGEDEELEASHEGDGDEKGEGQEFEEFFKWIQHCFAADSEVEVEHLGTVRMEQIENGHRLKQSDGGFSQVFAFTHRLPHGLFAFRKLCTIENRCLTASHGHYIFGEDRLVTAGAVKVGDLVQLANGSLSEVRYAENVWRRGLYNPQTMSGELVVDGFRVSSYTMSLEPKIAQTLLAPLRAAYRVFGVDLTRGSIDHVGAVWRPAPILQGGQSIAVNAILG